MDERTSHAAAPVLTVTVGTADPLDVRAGEDVVLRLTEGTCDSVVAALLGLVESPAIVVEIAGRSWAQRDAWEMAALRGAMGWTFVRSAWLSNFSVLENVTLQARHHGDRPDAEIVATADDLAQRLGLSGIPRERPHLCEADVLRRCEWVRALMHQPALLLLAQPERGAEAARIDWRGLSRGGAVVGLPAGESSGGGLGRERPRGRFDRGRAPGWFCPFVRITRSL